VWLEPAKFTYNNVYRYLMLARAPTNFEFSLIIILEMNLEASAQSFFQRTRQNACQSTYIPPSQEVATMGELRRLVWMKMREASSSSSIILLFLAEFISFARSTISNAPIPPSLQPTIAMKFSNSDHILVSILAAQPAGRESGAVKRLEVRRVQVPPLLNLKANLLT
jgi:hypothetical protein